MAPSYTLVSLSLGVHFARHANSARAIKYNVSDRERAKNTVLVPEKIRRRYIYIYIYKKNLAERWINVFSLFVTAAPRGKATALMQIEN